MSYPAQAFTVMDAADVPFGQFFRFEENWYFSVLFTNGPTESIGSIQLTGQDAGLCWTTPSGRSLVIAFPYTVTLRFDEPPTKPGVMTPAAIYIGDETFFRTHNRNGTPFTFGIDGRMIKEDIAAYHGFQAQKWEGWLHDGQKPIGPLFKVGEDQQA